MSRDNIGDLEVEMEIEMEMQRKADE